MSNNRIGGVIPTPLRQELFTAEDIARLDGLGEVQWTGSAEPLSTPEAIALLEGCAVG